MGVCMYVNVTDCWHQFPKLIMVVQLSSGLLNYYYL